MVSAGGELELAAVVVAVGLGDAAISEGVGAGTEADGAGDALTAEDDVVGADGPDAVPPELQAPNQPDTTPKSRRSPVLMEQG